MRDRTIEDIENDILGLLARKGPMSVSHVSRKLADGELVNDFEVRSAMQNLALREYIHSHDSTSSTNSVWSLVER